MHSRALQLSRLNAILDKDIAEHAGWTVPDLARAYFAGGARFLQIRAKQLSSGDYLTLCDQVLAASRSYGAIVIVNDRADIARLCGASGVHVGQDDLPASAARQVLGQDAILGLSTHTPEQISAALAQPIDYLAVGPVFGTSSKNTGYAAVGLELVEKAGAMTRSGQGGSGVTVAGVVAIGGITLARARDVIAAGATSVAVISDLLTTRDPERRVREYLTVLEDVK